MKVILQTNQSDCLLACAAMIMNTLGCKVPVYKLIEKIELSMAGSNILQLKEALGEYGFSVEGYKIDVQSLNQTIMPVIAYVKNGHFIVLDKMSKNQFTGVDPAIGRIKYSFDEFQKIYSGVRPKYFQYQYNKISYRLPIEDIIYFQSDRRVTYIITNDGSKKCYGKLNDIEKHLVESDTYFYRTHQSFLVNPKYVTAYFYDSMELADGTTLSISENRRKRVSELFCMLKGEDIIV